jgi:phage-related protein
MPTFSPSINPSFPLQRKRQPRTLFNEFGDGYVQRAADGINSNRLTIELTWGLLTTAQRNELNSFFTARNGHESFDWTLPDTSETLKFICQNWSDSFIEPGLYSMQATFMQVFDVS